MQKPIIPLLLALFGLGAPLRVWAAPAAPSAPSVPGAPGAKDIETVYNLARVLHEKLHCSPVAPGAEASPANVAAAVEFGYLGSLYGFAVDHYPTDIKGDRISQLNTLVEGASRAYGQAYACDPSAANVLYLHRAITILQVHLQQLDASHPRAEEFRQRSAMLSSRLPEAKPCPICDEKPPPPPPPPDTGYRARYAGRVALGLGLGGGMSRLNANTALSHFTLRFTLGPRFTLGKRKRGILGTGLLYAFHSVRRVDGESPAKPSAIHQAGPYLELGFTPVPNFSLHGHGGFAITAGVVDFPESSTPTSFHSFNLGGGGALCTLRGTLCARVHGYRSITFQATKLKGYDITLHLDFFRLADLVLDRRARRAEQSTSQPTGSQSPSR